MNYLYWRGKSLWCRYPLEGYPQAFPLEIYTTGSKADSIRCEKDGEAKLAVLRSKAMEGTLFDKKEKPVEYNPKFWRVVGRYWYHHLRFKKSGSNERYHLAHSLKKFGTKFAKEIYRENVELWLNEMRQSGSEVNTINNRFAYLQAAYEWANTESNTKKRLGYDPTIGMKKMSGGKVRTFLLTKEKFERNYVLLKDGRRWCENKPSKHCTDWEIPPIPRFARFYLGLFETGRRPDEVSQYRWEMVNTLDIDGKAVHFFSVPPELAKTDVFDVVIISGRLWNELSLEDDKSGFVFKNQDGNRWRNWCRHKQKLEKVFGADCGWIRDTRRGFVTHKAEVEKKDPKHIKGQTGQKTWSMFDRYRIGKLRNQIDLFSTDTTDTTDPSHTNCIQFEKKDQKTA